MSENGNQEYPTILGPDAVVRGELTFEKGMRVHGRIEGRISTTGRLLVAKEAKIQADIDAGNVTVEGEINGNLSASERVELKQSARYTGDLRAGKLVVDEGAAFSGHVTVGPEAAKAAPAARPTVTHVARTIAAIPAAPAPVKTEAIKSEPVASKA